MKIVTIAAFLLSAQVVKAQPLFPDEEQLQGKSAGDLVLKPGRIDRYKADWGWLFVPENRTRPESRLIRLAVVRQQALKEPGREALFHLAGGPGNSNVWGIDIQPVFFTDNDLVRVGYRGIDSSVELKCPEFRDAMLADRPLSADGIDGMSKALRGCHDRLTREGIDLNGYNLVEVADDIEAARKALGYEKINLLAVSWGTQIAYVYCLKYPDRVHRAVLVGAGSRSRGLTRLWPPPTIDKMLAQYADLWKNDDDAAARSPDLIATIRNVMATLPRQWRHILIDPDKVRLSTFYLLRDTGDAVQVFDAFVAAEKGDYSGLAVLSWGYDEDLRHQRREYYSEFFCKAVSSGMNRETDFVHEMDPPGSVIGSPAAKLLWGAAREGWPAEQVPQRFRAMARVDAETLVVMGNLDFAAPLDFVRDELMPNLPRGKLIVLSDMGHTDVIRLQHEAFEHLADGFLREGAADTSKFQPNRLDFSPNKTLGDYAREKFGEH